MDKLHSPNEWTSWLPSNPKKKLTIHVRRLCCLRAPRTVQPLDRAAVQPTLRSLVTQVQLMHSFVVCSNNEERMFHLTGWQPIRLVRNFELRHGGFIPLRPWQIFVDSKFLRALGTEDVFTAPPQTSALSLNAAEESERCICRKPSLLHPAPSPRRPTRAH